MADEMHPFGLVLAYSDDDTTYTNFTLVKMVTPPNISRGSMEVTNLSSTEAWREFLQGWKDAGMIRLELFLAKAITNTLLGTGAGFFGAAPGAANKWFRVTFPLIGAEITASTIKAKGHLVELGFSEARAASDEALTLPAGVKLTGKPTWTSGS